MVYSLAATTLTVAAPIGCDTSSAEGAEPRAADGSTRAGVVVTGNDDEMLVLEVTAANRVVVRLPRVEVGQGVTTAVAMMIAEELDARLADVDIPLADARTKEASTPAVRARSARCTDRPGRWPPPRAPDW